MEKMPIKKTKEPKNYFKKSEKDFNCWREFFQYFCMKFLYGFTFKIMYRLEVHGRENIPKTNDFVVAANHLSTLDPPLMTNILPLPAAFMAKMELFNHPLLKIMLDWLGAFAVNRDKLGVSTIKTAIAVKKSGRWVLGVFPQGTREKGNEIRNVTKGFAGLAKTTKCNILPIGIIGTDKPVKIPFTGKIIVRIGPVIPLSDDADEMFDNWIKAIQELTGFKYVPDVAEVQEANVVN